MSKPFPYGSGSLTDAERNANYEAIQIARKRVAETPESASMTRSAVLNCMGAWTEGLMAKSEIMALLDQHEANLRKAWEDAELGHAQRKAHDAIRGAVRAVMDGKLI